MPPQSLEKSLLSGQLSPSSTSLWQWCLARDHPYAPTKIDAPPRTMPPPGGLPKVQLDQVSQAYLPCEWFRDPSMLHFAAKSPARTFLSSGTTANDRSQVSYSGDGLELYRLGSIWTFQHVLTSTMGRAAQSAVGISLIPKVSIWPDSSLAQMIAWLAEAFPMIYSDADGLQGTLQSTGSRPVWLFGTAFDLVNMFDAGIKTALPPGSVVIETGGTKGRARSVSRTDLYQLIAEKLDVAPEKIISEYGMCELASQAYDWVPDRATAGPRGFRFPSWVEASVFKGLGQAAKQGTGSLAVSDPLRLDLPCPIRTQDVVSIEGASFQLLGRALHAPLKGCSLNSEVLALDESDRRITHSKGKAHRFSWESISKALTGFQPLWRKFLEQDAILTSLTEEVGDRNVAQAIISDLDQSFCSQRDWQGAFKTAFTIGDSETCACPSHWLVILPSNHSLAGVAHLVFGALVGLRMFIRIPETLTGRLLGHVIQFLQDQCRDSELVVLNPEQRLPSIDIHYDAVLAFGTNATVSELAQLAHTPIKAFGEQLAISVTHAADLAEQGPRIMYDAFSLRQSGCMSSRGLIIEGVTPGSRRQVLSQLQADWHQFWKTPLCARLQASLDHEDLRWQQRLDASPLRLHENDILFPDVTSYPELMIASKAFCLPITFCEEGKTEDVLMRLYRDRPTLGLVFKDEQSDVRTPVRSVPHGMSHSLSWTGRLWDSPLFALDEWR